MHNASLCCCACAQQHNASSCRPAERHTMAPSQPVRRAQGAAAGAQVARAQAPGARPAHSRASRDCWAGAPRHRHIRPGHSGSMSCACAHRRLPMRAVVCLHSPPHACLKPGKPHATKRWTLVTRARPAWLKSCMLGTQKSSTLLATPLVYSCHSELL